jgi:hypothetical protein
MRAALLALALALPGWLPATAYTHGDRVAGDVADRVEVSSKSADSAPVRPSLLDKTDDVPDISGFMSVLAAGHMQIEKADGLATRLKDDARHWQERSEEVGGGIHRVRKNADQTEVLLVEEHGGVEGAVKNPVLANTKFPKEVVHTNPMEAHTRGMVHAEEVASAREKKEKEVSTDELLEKLRSLPRSTYKHVLETLEDEDIKKSLSQLPDVPNTPLDTESEAELWRRFKKLKERRSNSMGKIDAHRVLATA